MFRLGLDILDVWSVVCIYSSSGGPITMDRQLQTCMYMTAKCLPVEDRARDLVRSGLSIGRNRD